MADLYISDDYLASLRGSFDALTAMISIDDDVADHSACGSDAVATAGNYLTTIQRSRATIAAGNATAMGLHAGTTSVEIAALDQSLARSAGDL